MNRFNNWQTISHNKTIKEAMTYLNEIPLKTLLVVKNKKLIATITDGDIRRGLLKGHSLNSKITEIGNYNFKYVNNLDETKRINNLFEEFKLSFIPVIDSKFQILDIVFNKLSTIKTKNNNHKVFILAGGEGKRLKPLTNDIPKPILKVGKSSIIEIIFNFFKNSGYFSFIVSLNYKKKEFKKFLSKISDLNYEIVEETNKLGTAGSLSLIRNIKHPFFIINGDIICNTDYSQLMKFHIKNKAKLTIVTKRIEKSSQYGVLKIGQKNLIKDILEKPIEYEFINAGIYVADPIILKHIPKNQRLDMPELIKKLIKKRYKILAYEMYDYWRDIGTLENLTEVRNAISHMLD